MLKPVGTNCEVPDVELSMLLKDTFVNPVSSATSIPGFDAAEQSGAEKVTSIP